MSSWTHKQILVTGGGGFIGLNLVARLLEDGARVRVAENFERGNSDSLARFGNQIQIVAGDLREAAICRRACRDIDAVFHLASKVGSSDLYRRLPADVLLHNLMLDAQVLQAARYCRVPRYLHASSALVYPLERQSTPDAAPLKEEEAYPPNPANSYGWAKLMAEKALQYAVAQDNDLRGVILRFSNVYGPHQSLDLRRGSIVPVLVRRAVEYPRRAPFFIKGSGQETRTYCYVSDVIEAMLLAMERLDQRRLIGPLNIGNEESIRIIDLARKVIAVSGKHIELVTLPAPPPVTQSQTLDSSRAHALLDGWRPRVSLDDGLRHLYRYAEAELTKYPDHEHG